MVAGIFFFRHENPGTRARAQLKISIYVNIPYMNYDWTWL